MGFFDKLTGNKDVALSPQAGLLLAAITMVAIDGDMDDDELAVIRRLDGSNSTTAWESAVKTWKAKTARECVPIATAAMNQEQRVVAMDVASFGVDGATVQNIVEVVAIKNNKDRFQ